MCNGDVCASALSVLTTAAAALSREGDAAPVLSARLREGSDPDPCADGPPLSTGVTAIGISIEVPTDGTSLCSQVTAYYEAGRITAVAVPFR